MLKVDFKALFSALIIAVLLALGTAHAGTQAAYPRFSAQDNAGRPLSGGKLYTYITGTNTPKTAFLNAALTQPAPNPIILDGRGEATFYLATDSAYRFVLRTSADVSVWPAPVDNVQGIGDLMGLTALFNAHVHNGTDTSKVDVASLKGVAGPVYKAKSYASLAAALTALGATNQATLEIEDDLAGNDTVPANVTLHFVGKGRLTGTPTINGRIVAPARQIFTSQPTIGLAQELRLEWFGTDVTGATNSYPAFSRASTAAAAGSTLLGLPGAIYRVDSEWLITKRLTINGQGATVKSAVSNFFVHFNGDSGVAGDWSAAVQDAVVENWIIGTANDSSNLLAGVKFEWCIRGIARNIVKKGKTRTAFNTIIARDCLFENVWNIGADDQVERIGFLAFASDRTRFVNCHVQDGAFLYAFQTKGGYDNLAEGCTVTNVVASGAVTPEQGFRDRGWSPWGASEVQAATYPFSTGTWTDTYDPRRASWRTVFRNCSVRDSPAVVAFSAQEAIGTLVEGCYSDNVKQHIAFARILGDAVDGEERDFMAIGHRGVTAALQGVVLTSGATTKLPGCKVIGGHIDASQREGLDATNTDGLLVSGLTIKNSSRAASNTYDGIQIDATNTRPTVRDVRVIDDGTPLQRYGMQILASWPTVSGAYVSGHVTRPYNLWVPGFYSDVTPAVDQKQTTDGSAATDAWRSTLTTGETVWIEMEVVGAQSDNSNQAAYRIGGLFRNNAGIVAQIGTTQTLLSVETNAAWGASFTVSGAVVRGNVTGAAGATVDWRINAKCVPVK